MTRREYEVRAVVEARLLGLRLLSLRAHVITGQPPRSLRVSATEPLAAVPSASNGSSGQLVEAINLLSEGSTTLRTLSTDE